MAKEQTDREYDSSALVWEMYRIIYEGGMLSNVFEIKKYNPEIKRNYDEIQVKDCKSSIYKIFSGDVWNAMSKPKGTRASLSGDVIFNFTYSKNKSCQFYIYQNWINQDQNPIRKNKYLNLLNKCRSMHHSFENCALMLQQGNLQTAKQGIGNDRGDTFIWALDEYYKETSGMVLNHATQQNSIILKEFLDYFNHVYKYCEVFYNISDIDLIFKLIKSGRTALDSVEKVEHYIDLALKFWDERAKYMKNKYKENRENYIKEKHLKYDEKNFDKIFTSDEKETVEDYVIRVEEELHTRCQQYEKSELYKEIIIYDCKCALKEIQDNGENVHKTLDKLKKSKNIRTKYTHTNELKDLLTKFVCKEDEQLIDKIQNNNKELNELYRSLLKKCKKEQVNKIKEKIHSVSNNNNQDNRKRKSVKDCEAEINTYYEELLKSFPCDEKTKASQSENPSSTPAES